MPVIVYALDVSISMEKSFSNFSPSKLEASANAMLAAARIAMENGFRVGLVVFAEWALPLVVPTDDIGHIIGALKRVGRTFLGSAPGDAVAEAVRLVRYLPERRKRIVLITDGDYNMGVPLDYALLYAHNVGVETHIIVIGSLEGTELGRFHAKTPNLAVWHEVGTIEELSRVLTLLSR